MKYIYGKLVLLTIVCLFGLLFAGCAATPAPTFYQLEESVNAQLGGDEQGLVVGLELLSIPNYLDRPQVVTRIAEHKLILSESHMWAEPLKKSIARVICVNLSNQLKSNRVFSLPQFDRKLPLDFKIVLTITRFDGTLGDQAHLAARWSLYGEKNELLLTRISIVNQAISGRGYDSLVTALNQTLQDLSREIAEVVNSRRL